MKNIRKDIKETLSNYNLFKTRIKIIKNDLETFKLIQSYYTNKLIQLGYTKEKKEHLQHELKQLTLIVHNIDNILQRLTIREREIIIKKYILKYTWINIANELRISVKTCQRAEQSALNKIIKILSILNSEVVNNEYS